MLHGSLDVFDLRRRDRNRVDQDLGLLHAVDERLSVWGWETGTGTRIAIVLDMWGRDGVEGTGLGVKEGELKPVSTSQMRHWEWETDLSMGISRASNGVYQAVAEPVLQA